MSNSVPTYHKGEAQIRKYPYLWNYVQSEHQGDTVLQKNKSQKRKCDFPIPYTLRIPKSPNLTIQKDVQWSWLGLEVYEVNYTNKVWQ